MDVRFVCATNRVLQDEVRAGNFREDLFFRLNVIPITLPALRDRGDDVIIIANHFIGVYREQMNSKITEMTEEVENIFKNYAWPGNVRELINVVQRMAVMSSGETIEIAQVPDEIRSSEVDDSYEVGSLAGIGLDKLEKEAIRQTLAMTGGNREQTSNLLGIGERTLYRKLKEYGIK